MPWRGGAPRRGDSGSEGLGVVSRRHLRDEAVEGDVVRAEADGADLGGVVV